MNRATLAATVKSPLSADGAELTALPQEIDWLELRADVTGDVPASWLQQRFPGRMLYSLTSRAAGGNFDGSDDQRSRRLIDAAKQFSFVQLEVPHDLTPTILNSIPPENRIILYHGPAADLPDLQRRFEKLSRTPARYYRLSQHSASVGQSINPLLFLKKLGRSDVIAYLTGAAGTFTRVLAPYFGWPIVFGTAFDRADVHGGPSIEGLIRDYGLPYMRNYQELYGIVGNPLTHSLSPRLHNSAYRVTGQPAIFVPLWVDDFVDFWQSFVLSDQLAELGFAVRGLTIASPHKEATSRIRCDQSELVKIAQSSNLLYRYNGKWRADTTDADGVLFNLRVRSIPLHNCNVAVVGCGGSGRAIATALKQAGASVTMFNRSVERGHRATQLLGLSYVPLSEFHVDGFSVVVNATPVGRDGRECPVKTDGLRKGSVVVDLTYGSAPTPLTEIARSGGLITIDGRDILCTQVMRQFHYMTGKQMPPGLAEELTKNGQH